MSGFLMIILTLADNGQMSAAFVNTATMQECEARAAVVRSILENDNYPVERMVCRAADIEFEPFVHGKEEPAERPSYLISLDSEIAKVTPVRSCALTQTGTGQFCATSTQKIVTSGN